MDVVTVDHDTVDHKKPVDIDTVKHDTTDHPNVELEPHKHFAKYVWSHQGFIGEPSKEVLGKEI